MAWWKDKLANRSAEGRNYLSQSKAATPSRNPKSQKSRLNLYSWSACLLRSLVT